MNRFFYPDEIFIIIVNNDLNIMGVPLCDGFDRYRLIKPRL